jgi:hypothetical protein
VSGAEALEQAGVGRAAGDARVLQAGGLVQLSVLGVQAGLGGLGRGIRCVSGEGNVSGQGLVEDDWLTLTHSIHSLFRR